MLDALVQDTRYALRWLLRSPGFAIVAILSLGVGIGCNTAIFAVVDALLLRPLPVREPSRLVDLYTSGADGDTYSTNSLPDLLDYREQKTGVRGRRRLLADVCRREPRRSRAAGPRRDRHGQLLLDARRLGAPRPDASRPKTMRLTRRGRWCCRIDIGSGSSAASPRAVGRTLRIRGQEFTIVGVLDDGFTGMVPMLAPEIWVPVRFAEEVEPAGINETVPSPTGSSRHRSPRAALAVRQGAADAATRRSSRRAPTWRSSLRGFAPSIRKRTKTGGSRSGRPPIRGSIPKRTACSRGSSTRHDARGRPRAGHRVRERRRHAAGARGGPAARDCHPPRRRRRAGPSRPPAPDRKRHPRRARRWRRRAARRRGSRGCSRTFDLPIPIALSLDLRLDARVLGFTAGVALLTGILAGLAPALRATRANLVWDLKGDTSARGSAAGAGRGATCSSSGRWP